MASYIIDGSEFGINTENSSVQISGENFLDIEIYGDEDTHEALTRNEESKWSWTLYPPHFYLYAYPIDSPSDVRIELRNENLDQYEFALYLMEHNDFEGTVVIQGDHIHVSGKADVFGEVKSLEIKWQFR